MTRTGGSKRADPTFANNRLVIARSFKLMAENSLAMAEIGNPMNPVMSNAILAAIAYADALTAKFGGKVNQKDHTAIIALLRDALGNRLPKKQETAFYRILAVKDDVQYGPNLVSASDANRILELLNEFARWAEDEYAR